MITLNGMKTIYDGMKFNEATEILNEGLEMENGFYCWIDLPDGTQFVIPKGSKISSLNYSIDCFKKCED